MTEPRVGKVVEAERFILRDASGKIRAELGVEGDGMAALRLYDTAGQRRAELAVNAGGTPWLGLYDETGKVRAFLHAEDLVANLALYDGAEKVRALLQVVPNVAAALGLYDGTGERHAEFRVEESSEEEGSSLEVAIYNGKAQAALRMEEDEENESSLELILRDAAGKRRAELAVHGDGWPLLGLYDKDGKVIWDSVVGQRSP